MFKKDDQIKEVYRNKKLRSTSVITPIKNK